MCSKKVDDTANLSAASVAALLAAYPQLKHLLVAYSGGADSHVLLHVLATHREALAERTLSAVYVNHHLQPAATDWEHHCERICRQLDVRFRALQVDARADQGASPEAAARNARYAALAQLLAPDTALLTAHHRNDQAETLLLQLLRGAGPHGLAAMPVAKPLGHGLLLRPLLAFEREQLLYYARCHQLHWIEDPSNDQHELNRNYLRHAILPPLQQRWPAVLRTLTRSAGLCAETAQLCDEIAEQDLIPLLDRDHSLAIKLLLAFSPARQRNILRGWLRRLQLTMPSHDQLHRIFDEIIVAAPDRQPLLHWPDGEIRRFRNRLYAMPPLPSHDPGQIISWTGDRPVVIPAIGTLQLVAVQGQGLSRTFLEHLTIRFRGAGELFHPHGQSQRRTLKKLLYEAGIPPWQRERLPLLYSGDRLLAVADIWIEQKYSVKSAEPGVVLRWQKIA